MSSERKYDQLDFAQVTSFSERARVEEFARAAVSHLTERPDRWTFTSAEIDGELLAIRWGSAGQDILICRLDETFRVTVFGDSLPPLEKIWGGDGGGWVFYACQTRTWSEGFGEPVDGVCSRLAEVLAAVAERYLMARGATGGPARVLRQRLAEEAIPSAFRRVFGRSGGAPQPEKLRVRVTQPKGPQSEKWAAQLVIDLPGEPELTHDGRGLTRDEAEAVAEVWNRSLEPAPPPLRVFRRASGGALVCDLPIPGITSPLSGETAADYGAPFFVAESMGLETARALAHALGGVLQEDVSLIAELGGYSLLGEERLGAVFEDLPAEEERRVIVRPDGDVGAAGSPPPLLPPSCVRAWDLAEDDRSACMAESSPHLTMAAEGVSASFIRSRATQAAPAQREGGDIEPAPGEEDEFREADDRLHQWLLSTGIDDALAKAQLPPGDEEAAVDARRLADVQPPLTIPGFTTGASLSPGWFVTVGPNRFWFDLDLWDRLAESRKLELLTKLLRSRTPDGLQPAVSGYGASSGFRVSWRPVEEG